MIDRVALALREHIIETGGNLSGVDAYGLARAAIAAMAKPTEDMIDAVREIGGSQWAANAHATWPTMIEAALHQPRTTPS